MKIDTIHLKYDEVDIDITLVLLHISSDALPFVRWVPGPIKDWKGLQFDSTYPLEELDRKVLEILVGSLVGNMKDREEEK